MSIDRLYQVPLADFVTARNELAQSLKKAGDAEQAQKIKALTKPSASAWAVNQLYWRERATFDAMIAAGDDLRESLESGPSPEAERIRADTIERALLHTKAILEQSGQNVTDTLMRRVAMTLDALASYASANPSPMRGRLTEDVSPPGFGAFRALSPALPEPPPATPEDESEDEPEDEIAKHEAAVEIAKANVEEATRRVKRLEAELETLEKRLLEARSAAKDAALQHADAETKLLEARANNESQPD